MHVFERKGISSTSSISGILALFALLGCLVFFSSLPQKGLFYPQLINSGHAFVFFFAHFLLLRMLFGQRASKPTLIFIGAFSLSLGLVIELVQPYFGRNRSFLDVVYDLIGILFASLCFVWCSRYQSYKSYRFFTGLLLFLILSLTIPTYRYWVVHQLNHSSALLSFESDWEKLAYSISPSVVSTITESKTMPEMGNTVQLHFSPAKGYPGIAIYHAKQDWRRFEYLNWIIDSKEESEFRMTLRVHDRAHNNNFHDRFNYSFQVIPGVKQYHIAIKDIKAAPHGRDLDLSELESVILFVAYPKHEIEIELGGIWLTQGLDETNIEEEERVADL